MEQLIFDLVFSVVGAGLLTACSYKMFQIYQLSSYRTKGVFNWFKASRFDYAARYFALAFLSFMGMFVYIGCFGNREYIEYIGSVVFVGFSAVFIIVTKREHKKTPLKFTPRVKRAITLAAVLYFGLVYGLLNLGHIWAPSYALSAAAMLLIPVVSALANILLLPFEKMNNAGYKRRAERVLASMPHLIKIGITGSFGKTSAKNILAAMLKKKYKVAFSPSSYNTPMGLSLVINNDLKPTDEVFIAEMGARNVGDIKELALMIQPNYGLITSIGSQHLETFGTVDNIVRTKYELVENLAVGGLAVFNGDGEYTVGMFDRCGCEKLLTGAEGLENASATYSDVCVGTKGTEFTMNIGGKSVRVSTRLLGKHIPALMLSCAAIANSLGVEPEDIATACSEIAPVPHRLELIDRGDTVVIDDAYNANSEGARNALEILGKFEGARIVVTPGLVELGTEEKTANEQLGKAVAANADYAVLVGTRGESIKKGASDAGMADERIFVVADLNEGMEKLKEIQGKKAVLFENDLPDNY